MKGKTNCLKIITTPKSFEKELNEANYKIGNHDSKPLRKLVPNNSSNGIMMLFDGFFFSAEQNCPTTSVKLYDDVFDRKFFSF